MVASRTVKRKTCRFLTASAVALHSLSNVRFLGHTSMLPTRNDSFLSISKQSTIFKQSQYFSPRIVFLSSGGGDHVARSSRRVPSLSGNHVNETAANEAPEWEIESVTQQHSIHLTCNSIHEMELLNGTFLFSQGFSRLAVRMDDLLLLRPLRLSQSFSPLTYHRQNMDSVIMEMLTNSRNIPSEYAFCGQTILNEFLPRTLQEKVRRKNIRPLKRLEFARDAALALANLHALGALAHMDVHIKNFLLRNGTVYLNDFNHAYFGTGPTAISGNFGIPLGPPECSQNNCTFYDGYPQYFDLYCLGNVLFEIWTRRFPYEDMDFIPHAEIVQRKKSGEFPPLPEKRPADDPALTAIYEAVHASYRQNPQERPSAAGIARALGVAYETLVRNETKTPIEALVREMLN